MDDASHRRLELAATVLLAMAAVATAWAAYQSARWHSEQAKGQSASIAARVESTRAADVANRQAQIDVALFTQWVDAYATDKTELARFYRKRFRPEFRPAFVAWVATKPRTNPNAPLSPFAMPQYKLAANAMAEDLERQAAAASESVGSFIQRADDYSLAVVLFAASLFFAGISTRLRAFTPRMVIVGLGYALFLGSVIWIATFPVTLSVSSGARLTLSTTVVVNVSCVRADPPGFHPIRVMPGAGQAWSDDVPT